MFKLLYTNITELNLSKHLPIGCFMKLSLKSFCFLYLLIYFIFYNISYLFIHWPLVLLLFYLNVEQLWQHCLILYDLTTAIYFTLWVFHLFNKWPTTCNALICAIGSLWCFSLIWPLNEGTTLIAVSLRLVYWLISLDLLYNVWYYLVVTLLTSTFKNFVLVI